MSEDVTAISGPGLSATISPMGAELRSLRDAAGHDLLWDGDPSYWTGRAPLLFPIVGALRKDRYRLDGSTYHLPKHGFARRRRFTLVNQAADEATFRLEADDETRATYPFEFRLDMRFAIRDATLLMEAFVSNFGRTTMPASFGFHPALRWPLPYGQPRDAHSIRFERPEPAPIRRIDAAGLVMPTPEPSPIKGDVLPLEDTLFIDDALILDHPESRRVFYGAEEGPKVEVSFPDMPMLGIWTKPGAGYICIEPWQGIADPEGFTDDVFGKPGILPVCSGETRRFAMTIALDPG